MSTRNSPKHFTVGIGVYSPWSRLNHRVRKALTDTAPKRKYQYAAGVEWRDGKLIPMKLLPSNRMVRRVDGRLERPMTISRGRVIFVGVK